VAVVLTRIAGIDGLKSSLAGQFPSSLFGPATCLYRLAFFARPVVQYELFLLALVHGQIGVKRLEVLHRCGSLGLWVVGSVEHLERDHVRGLSVSTAPYSRSVIGEWITPILVSTSRIEDEMCDTPSKVGMLTFGEGWDGRVVNR